MAEFPRQVLLAAILIAVALGLAAGPVRAASPSPKAGGLAPSALSAYLTAHPEMTAQRKLSVSYDTYSRTAFWIRAADYELRYDLRPRASGIGVLRVPGSAGSLLEGRSLNICAETPDGVVYESIQSLKASRINIFRHGPHFYDVHVLDIELASGTKALPIKGEVVFYAYPDRLYGAVKLYPTASVTLKAAWLEFSLKTEAYSELYTDAGVTPVAPGSLVESGSPFTTALGFGSPGAPTMGFAYPQQRGTQRLSVSADTQIVRVRQYLRVPEGPLAEGQHVYACFRPLPQAQGGFSGLRQQAFIETHPLGAADFSVGQGTTFDGYVPSRGYYAISTESGLGFNEHYAAPNDYPVAAFAVRNDEHKRELCVQHSDSLNGGILEGAAVTDSNGLHLPILTQVSKNFCGEDEEPFYVPGDGAYSESYFPLTLEPNAALSLRSYHLFEGWGNHRVKQISSLQAWMPYYHMSTGVTETTCYVPFRFGGHLGIDIADLRGISGTMWDSQPQFDNAGGHRFFRYTDRRGQHASNYLESQFYLTSPNIADWGMIYETEGQEARVSFRILEIPQGDETRSFNRMRVSFDKALTIDNPAKNLQLLQIDTYTQRHKYGKVGYTDASGALVEVPVSGRKAGTLLDGAVLSKDSPMFALYACPPDSGQKCNNGVIIRAFSGTVGGRTIETLTVSAKAFADGNMAMWLTLPGSTLRFEPGDYIDIDFIVMPYGAEEADASAPLKTRESFGIGSPKVSAQVGEVLSEFPCRIEVTADGTAEFTMVGGYDTMPVLVQGLNTYEPPLLERLEGKNWVRVPMTLPGATEGHQTYVTGDGRFGFVFLCPTDGSATRFRTVKAPSL